MCSDKNVRFHARDFFFLAKMMSLYLSLMYRCLPGVRFKSQVLTSCTKWLTSFTSRARTQKKRKRQKTKQSLRRNPLGSAPTCARRCDTEKCENARTAPRRKNGSHHFFSFCAQMTKSESRLVAQTHIPGFFEEFPQ